MGANDRPRDGEGRPRDGHHLSQNEFNRYLDHDLAPAERRTAEAHLAACPECRATLADLQLLASLLHDLPQVEAPRSFQLGPEHERRPSIWDRLGAMLLPMLPAMRAATVTLALMLGGVTAYRIVDEPPSTGPQSEQAGELPAPAAATAISGFAPTSTLLPATNPTRTTAPAEPVTKAGDAANSDESAADRAAGAAAPVEDEKTDDAEETTSSDEVAADSAAGNTAMIAMEIASPAESAPAPPSPTAPVSPSAVATATAIPAPTPTIAAAHPAGAADRSSLTWIQVALAGLFVGFGTLAIGVARFGRRAR